MEERIGTLLKWAVIWLLLTTLMKAIFRVPLLLIEDAVYGWLNRQIAKWLGMSDPTVDDLVQIFASWAPPAIAVIAVAGLGYLVAHLRQQQTKPANLTISPASALPPTTSSEPIKDQGVDIAGEVKRNVWLLDAIHRAATGEWKICDFDQLAEGKINEFVGVLEKIQQAAFDGDLPIWGKQARSDVWRPIPPGYWEYHGIDWFSMLKGDPENLKTEAKKTTKNVGVWWELMTSRKRVDDLWPTKTKDEALRELGRLREEGVHFRENSASQRLLLQADLEKIKAFEAAIIEYVEIISPGEATNFRVIDTFEPARHPAHVQGKQELLLFSERLRRLGEFITAHSRG